MLLTSELGELTYDDNRETDNWCIVSGRLLKLIFLSVQGNGHKWKDKMAWTPLDYWRPCNILLDKTNLNLTVFIVQNLSYLPDSHIA